MIASVVVALSIFILIPVSILFFPNLKLGKLKIDTYWIIALLGALILLFSGLVPLKVVGSQLTANNSINPLKILVLFFSMTILSIFLDEVGLFRYLAKKAVKLAKNTQFSLFITLYFLCSVLTIFTSNDIVILTLTPFICFFAKNTKINPIPYLVAEFAAANTWSMMLIIGNPTNIYLATSAGISFLDYLGVMALPTLVAGMVELAILFSLFYKQLKKPISIEEDDFVIESKIDLIIGLTHLIICLIFLVISSYIKVEMWLVSLLCALSLLICVILLRIVTKKNWDYVTKSFKRLPYQLIPFVLSMFVIVISLNYQGISLKIGEFFGSNAPIWVYGSTSFLAANMINNIPMSILYSSLPSSLSGSSYYGAIYATIIGSNIGAFLTPIGALAGIMFSNLVKKHDIKFTFIDFVKYGILIAVPTIAVSLGILSLVL